MPKVLARAGRVALFTQGCKVNQYDTQVLLEGFLARGWELVAFGEAAELTVINSCTVTAGADSDLRRLVARARRASGGGRVLVTGCRAEVDPAGSAELAGVDLVVGNRSKGALFGVLAGEAGPSAFPDRVSEDPITRFDGRGRAILKIQDGCNLRCSFCIVPMARGASRSRSTAETIARARLLAEHGYREIVLSGIQLGFYRDPDGEAADLATLLERLLAATAGVRYRLGSLLPRHLSPALRALLRAEPERLCPHLHISLQSGDDGVLRAMKRPYRAADYRELLHGLTAELPDPCLGTDLIVGHPGEDGSAFARCLDFVAELPLSYGHVFPYSPRPGTRSASLGGGAAPAEKAARSRALRAVLAAKGEAYRARQLGRRLAVIAEQAAAPDLWQGTSENYQRVLVSGAGAAAGALLTVRVTGQQGSALAAQRLAGAGAGR